MADGIPDGFTALARGGEFIAANGPLYLLQRGDVLKMGFRVESRHTNPTGICHGGMMASFCDMLLPVCAHHLRIGLAQRFLPTVSLQLDYLAPASLGAWVEGQAQLLRETRTLLFMQALVTADGEPAARVSGIFKIGGAFARRP